MNSSLMYRQHILELYKHPENFGELENATNKFEIFNSSCGDELKISLIVSEGKIMNVKFKGIGCAISIAAASLITDKIKGLTVEEVLEMNKDSVLELLGIEVTPGRIKCAMLCLEAVKGGLRG